jgi:hypothetical protein
MPNGKSKAKIAHPNSVYAHTRKDPAVGKVGDKFQLSVSYYARPSGGSVKSLKCSRDQSFSGDFGSACCSPGLYRNEKEAKTDMKKFRLAVDFEHHRKGRCGQGQEGEGE